jgi:hypothetical protein
MLENARCRIADQGRYDDGVARLYRTVEMFHQWRLKEQGISTEKVDWEGMDDGAKERFLSAAGLAQPPGELGLRHARLLDRILGGEVLEEDSTLRDLLQKRNRSILAHGFEPIGEAAARGFLAYVDAGGSPGRSAPSHAVGALGWGAGWSCTGTRSRCGSWSARSFRRMRGP